MSFRKITEFEIDWYQVKLLHCQLGFPFQILVFYCFILHCNSCCTTTRVQWCCTAIACLWCLTASLSMIQVNNFDAFWVKIAPKCCSDTCEAHLKAAVGLWLQLDVDTFKQKQLYRQTKAIVSNCYVIRCHLSNSSHEHQSLTTGVMPFLSDTYSIEIKGWNHL